MKYVEKVEKRYPNVYRTGEFPALLFEHMAEGVAVNRILFDSQDHPIDFEIIEVNPAYENILGISRERAVESRGSDLYGFETLQYIDVYARVARTGITEKFEAEYPALGKILDLVVFSPDKNYFVTVFSDEDEKKQTKERLELELEEKKVLLREMHHRVKNNLTVVSSLLCLQTDQVKTAEDARQALEESRNRIYSMALVHEHLYQTSCFSRVGMRSYIGEVIKELKNHHCPDKKVDFTYSIQDIHLDITLAVPIGIILNEILTNSLKHAFKNREEGRISVNLNRRNACTYKLSVRDDGPGFPEGRNSEDIDRLGIKLIKILAKQIQGNLTLRNRDGAEIEITFTLPPGSRIDTAPDRGDKNDVTLYVE